MACQELCNRQGPAIFADQFLLSTRCLQPSCEANFSEFSGFILIAEEEVYIHCGLLSLGTFPPYS